MPRRIRNTQRGINRPTPEDLERLRLAQILNDIDGAATVPLVQTDITDVSATAAEVNLLDLTGLTVGWALLADGPTSASWQALPGMFPGMIIQDEGAPLAGFADTLDFVGDGVTASGAGTTKTVTVANQQNTAFFLSGLFGTILNIEQSLGPDFSVDLAAALGLSSLQIIYGVTPAVPQITPNAGQPVTFDVPSAGEDVFALRDELDVDIMRVDDEQIAINRAIIIDYDTFQATEPQFFMTWDAAPTINASYIGGALSCSTVFDVVTGVFIPAIFSDTNRYDIGAAPGFSAITFINELAVIANNGNFDLPPALVMNIGMSHQRNTAGTSTTTGITGISFSPGTRTFIAGAVMTKTAQTAVRCSPTYGTVAGSTVNLGTITGLDCFAPAVGLFQPGAGTENMTAYYGINFPNMTFGGAGRVISVVRSLLNAATNVYFLDHTGTAPSRLGGDLDITGDIIISGTVDGRDVALDGTNQDNHIADATIHFTEASIDHLNIASIGVNSHAAIDTHIADGTIHFTEGSIDHTAISNIGVNSHAAIDTHIADLTIHFTEASIDHTAISNIGVNSHAAIDTHIADGTIHFLEGAIDHTNILNIGTNTHAQIDTHIADATIHFTEASIDHTAIANIGTNSHAAIDSHIADTNIHYADAPADSNDYVRNNNAWVQTPPGFNGLGIWRYRTETVAPPASGQIRFDNADVSLATEFYLHETNDTGDDVAAFLDALVDDGAVLYMQDRTDSTKYIIIETDTFVDDGVYRTYQIANIIEGSGGEPTNNTRMAIVAVSPAGGGAGGSLPAGTVTDAVLRWDGAAWVEETQARITSGGLFHAANGSAGGVAFGNVGDINTGMYFTGNDIVRFAAGAVNSVIIQNDRLLMNTAGGAEMMFESMTATNPGFTRLGDEDTGLSIHSGNMASLVAGGVEALRAEALQLTMGNYVFDTDQAVGAGQDNFVLTYDDAGGQISLEAAAGGVTDHTLLTNIGVNTHAQIDTHIADGTIHFTEASLNLATTYLALDCSNDPLTAPLELTANLIDLNNSGAATAVSIMGRNSAGGINMNVNTTTGHGQLGQISSAGAAEDVWIHMTRDGQVELRHNNTAMARTALIGSGGFEVNNTVTGAGFERVLTTSDLVSDTGITELTGDVTAGPGSGSQAATIPANTVSNTQLADMAANTVKVRTTGSGAPQDLSVITDRIVGNVGGVVQALQGSQVNTMLPLFTSGLKGLTPLSGGGTTNYLRADGTWATPPGTGGSPPGSDTEIIFNNGGAFGASSDFTWTDEHLEIFGAGFQIRIHDDTSAGDSADFGYLHMQDDFFFIGGNDDTASNFPGALSINVVTAQVSIGNVTAIEGLFVGDWSLQANTLGLNDNGSIEFGTGNDVSMLWNSTQFNMVGSGIWSITGFTSINAPAVDADFDNLTATDFNGVALTTAGVATNYLDETGNYSVPAGGGFTPPIDLADNEQIRFGTGQDFLMDFDGTQMHIEHVGATFATIWETAGGGEAINFRDGNTTGAGAAVSIGFADQVGTVYGAIGTTIITSTFFLNAPIGGMSISAAQGINISCGAANEIRSTTGSVWRWYETTEAEYVELDPVSTTQFNINLSNASSSLQFFGANFYRFNDAVVQCEEGLVVNDALGGFITFEDGGIERGSLQFSDTLGLMTLSQTSGHIFRIQRGINTMLEMEETGGLTIYENGAADVDSVNIQHDGADVRVTEVGATQFIFDAVGVAVEQAASTNQLQLSCIGSIARVATSSAVDLRLQRAGIDQFFLQSNTATGNTTGAQVKDHGAILHDVGFNDLRIFNDNVDDTLEAQHAGQMCFKDAATARTLTLASNVDLDFPVETMTTVVNAFTSGNYTVNEGASTTLYVLDGTTRVDSAGGITIGPGGVVNIWRESATVYYCWGSGITP